MGGRGPECGLRIDYFLISAALGTGLRALFIRPQVLGSDHWPVGID